MLEATVGSVNARAPFTFKLPPRNKPDQVISSFPTTFDSSLLTSVLTTAFGNGNIPRDLTFSASTAQPASTGAAGAARAKKSRSRDGARSHKPTLIKAVRKPKISLIAVDPRPQPALPVELVDKILSYTSITDQYRVAVALGDLPRRDRLVPLAFPHAVYPMDAATAAGDIDQLDAWLSRHLQNVAASQGQLSCTWYSSSTISLAMLAKYPRGVLRWWARSKLPLDKCIAAVMATNPSVKQLELLKAACLPAPNKETLRDFMDMASICGHTSTLEWLKTSGWAIDWTSAAMDCTKSIDAVKWWINSGLEVKYTETLLDNASKNGNIEMLEIWRTCGLTPRYSTEAMDYPSNSQVLEWWKSSAHEKCGWELRYTEQSMDVFSDKRVTLDEERVILDEERVTLDEERVTLDEERSLDILSWWRASGLRLKYSAAAIHPSVPFNIARWWKESLLPSKWQDSAIDVILSRCRPMRRCRGFDFRPPVTAPINRAEE
ncbi:hypothetical protein BDZ88DRAFT_79112 [Geranomyces variabilis]|nr:hypothetical protein BDZ88DRAFT_79112 [Geranomyces variabilis]KAJ3134815.1 hypothetical protein HDU90_004846 [Geranomyces variabilis]